MTNFILGIQLTITIVGFTVIFISLLNIYKKINSLFSTDNDIVHYNYSFTNETLEDLEQQLLKAIELQDFELEAALRDKINNQQ